jgi:hypothetical protein
MKIILLMAFTFLIAGCAGTAGKAYYPLEPNTATQKLCDALKGFPLTTTMSKYKG